MKRVYALNKQETPYIIFGCLAAIVSGAVQPVSSIILAKAISVKDILFVVLNKLYYFFKKFLMLGILIL